MKLEYLWKDPNSQNGACPALYRADGGYVVQGVVLDDETRAQLRDVAANEDAVFLPAAVLDRLKELS